MLLLLLILFTINCRQAEQATVSKTPLSQLMHKSILEIDSLLNDFQQEIRKEQSVLQVVDQEVQDAGLPGYKLTPGANHTGTFTRPPLLPYPAGHFSTTTKDPWESWNLPGLDDSSPSYSSPSYSSPSYSSPSYSSPSNPFSYFSTHGHLPYLDYSLDMTTPIIYGSTNPNYSAPFTRPSFPFQRRVTPVRPPRTELAALEPTVKYISNASHLSGFPIFRLPTKDLVPPGFLRSVTAGAKGRTLSKFFAMSDLHSVQRERPWRRPRGPRLTKANRMRATTARRPQPQQSKSTLSKAQAWVQNRQWMKNKAGRTLQRHIRQGKDNPLTIQTPTAISVGNPLSKQTPIPVDNLTKHSLDTSTPLSDGYTKSYETFSMPGLSDIMPSMSLPGLKDASMTTAGYVSNTPSSTFNPFHVHDTVTETAFTDSLIKEDTDGFLFVTSQANIPVPTTESTTNTIGQVLVNAVYFTASTPAPKAHQVLNGLMEKMDEGFLTIFLLELARLIAQKPTEHVIDVLKHFEIIYNKMYEKNTLAFFGEEILELGFKVSRMFSGHDISTLRIHAKMMHEMLNLRREYISVEVNSIIDYADMMFEDDEGEELFDALSAFYYFPNATISSYDVCYNMITSFVKPYQRLRGTDRLRKLTDSLLKVVATKFGNRRRGDTATLEPNQTINQTKRNPSSLRKRIETKRLQISRRQQQVNPLGVRAVLPITKHQKRFRVITPKQLRSNGYMGMLRPTQAYFRRKLGRPVHPRGAVLSLFPEFPQMREVEFKSRAQPVGEEPHHSKEPGTQPTAGAMREEVRRIVEESSYSDEEATLKMNLRHALRVNWHRTYTPTVKTSEAVAKY